MKLLLPFVLLFTTSLFAQNDIIVETPFNKFIKSPSIEWAINGNDSILFEKPNLANLLVKKMYAGKIKTAAYLRNNSIEEINIKYSSIEENAFRIDGGFICTLPLWDSNGNIISEVKNRKHRDTISSLMRISQKFYIENAKLFSYIAYVSPTKIIITPQDINLGRADIFFTAINKQNKTVVRSKDKIIYLTTTTKNLYVDSIKKEDKLKEMYSHNLIETLWPYIETNKIKIQLLPNNKQTTLKEINTNNLLNLESINIPLYDSIGNQSGNKNIIMETTPNIFDKITITQLWYYNDTKNIVFCKIPSAVITVKKYPNNNFMNNTVRQLRLVF